MADAITPSTGELKKLTIRTYKDANYQTPGDPDKFTAMFNPASYAEKYEVEYKAEQAHGNSASSMKFGSIKPKDYNFEFMIDGTGTVTDKVNVTDVIDLFLKACVQIVSDTHRPYFLLINWGNLNTKVVLKSADITYNLFDNDGKPIRAKIAASFTENIEDTLRVRQEGANSPDLTHYRQVKVGGKLPVMVYKEYDSHLQYLSVARANNLDNFRRLSNGSQLILPPIK
ncbi:MAG TPA: LysM peptidoglycan-binding domain-containing protein [Bacteroidia bacterium]|nr:LysM peptidoglycan-binding domain-containing protein [Bacteroidia bacterium]